MPQLRLTIEEHMSLTNLVSYAYGDNYRNNQMYTDTFDSMDDKVFDALKSGQLAFFETIDEVTKEVREDVSKFELDKERFLNLLTKVEEDVLSQQKQA